MGLLILECDVYLYLRAVPAWLKDFMENIHVGFEWYKLDGEFIEKTPAPHKSIRKRALLSIEPAMETLNHFIDMIDLQSQEQEIVEAEQRIRAAIPEPLKELYRCIQGNYLNARIALFYRGALKMKREKYRFIRRPGRI